ncbi:hypothetical protein FGIG_09442 [Fasciola gigantica]|uniref:Uncharacterized protein n=1 Tax=Fasciola gigantica TaxID=46835 RepID=A0A504Z0I4_FASGI|nr:hypothetical protein FGIG_09442 [Fasciola gigantica]
MFFRSYFPLKKLGIPHSPSHSLNAELGKTNKQSSSNDIRMDLLVDIRDSDHSVEGILVTEGDKSGNEDVVSTTNSTKNSAKPRTRSKSGTDHASLTKSRSPVCSACMSDASSSDANLSDGVSVSSSASSHCSYPRSSRRSSKSALRTPSGSANSGTENSDSAQSPRSSKLKMRSKHRASSRLKQNAHSPSIPTRIKGSVTTQDLVWMLQTGSDAPSNEFSLTTELNSILSATMSPNSFARYPTGMGIPQSRSVDTTLAKILMDENLVNWNSEPMAASPGVNSIDRSDLTGQLSLGPKSDGSVGSQSHTLLETRIPTDSLSLHKPLASFPSVGVTLLPSHGLLMSPPPTKLGQLPVGGIPIPSHKSAFDTKIDARLTAIQRTPQYIQHLLRQNQDMRSWLTQMSDRLQRLELMAMTRQKTETTNWPMLNRPGIQSLGRTSTSANQLPDGGQLTNCTAEAGTATAPTSSFKPLNPFRIPRSLSTLAGVDLHVQAPIEGSEDRKQGESAVCNGQARHGERPLMDSVDGEADEFLKLATSSRHEPCDCVVSVPTTTGLSHSNSLKWNSNPLYTNPYGMPRSTSVMDSSLLSTSSVTGVIQISKAPTKNPSSTQIQWPYIQTVNTKEQTADDMGCRPIGSSAFKTDGKNDLCPIPPIRPVPPPPKRRTLAPAPPMNIPRSNGIHGYDASTTNNDSTQPSDRSGLPRSNVATH